MEDGGGLSSRRVPTARRRRALARPRLRWRASRLCDEMRAQDISRGVQVVRRYLRQFRADPSAAARPTQLEARPVTAGLTCPCSAFARASWWPGPVRTATSSPHGRLFTTADHRRKVTAEPRHDSTKQARR